MHDAWAKFLSDVSDVQHGQRVPDKLRDEDLYIIRSRFIAYPVLGLMWASAQEQRWDTLSECDGWVNFPFARFSQTRLSPPPQTAGW